MAKTGDYFIVTLKRPHLEWGSFRHTDSRGIVYGEGYIQIPAEDAYRLEILNSNGTGGSDIPGKNIFSCSSLDGCYKGIVRAQGNQNDNNYAKQFAGDGDLKAIGDWYYKIGANEGDQIKVTWVDQTTITIEKL